MDLLNTPLQGDGYELLKKVNSEITPLVFFDPQYEKVANVLTRKDYPLTYQSDNQINRFICEIERALEPNGYLCLWINKGVLLECRIANWLNNAKSLKIVDLLVWNKNRLGLGSRFRNQVEFLVLIQKSPYRANFPDRKLINVWTESINNKTHPHQKPLQLLKRLIIALTKPDDLIIDPCAGSFVVLTACHETNRNFLGCDLTMEEMAEFRANH